MNERLSSIKKVLPVALLAGIALGGSAKNQPTEQIIGPAPDALREAYSACRVRGNLEDYKLISKSGDSFTVQYPMIIEQNPAVANDPDSNVVYRGLVARINNGGGRETPLFSDSSAISYDPESKIATHTLPSDMFDTYPAGVVLSISAQAEERKTANHHYVDIGCGDVNIDRSGPESMAHTSRTDDLVVSDRIVWTTPG